MIKIPFLDGFEYEKIRPYQSFVDSLNIEGWTLHDLGESTHENERLVGMSWGDLENKPTIYIQGQIHGGHEWRTSHWVKEFAHLISEPPYNANKGRFEYLRANYSFYLIPMVNPYGYYNYKYGNGNDVSLSRNFDFMWEETQVREGEPSYKGTEPFSEPESKAIRDVVLEHKPVGFLCTHTWGGGTGFFTRAVPQIREYDIPILDFYNSTVQSTEVSMENTLTMFDRVLQVPSAYNWASDQLASNGKPIFATVYETGALETEYEQARLGLTGLLLFCLQVDNHYKNTNLKINEA